MENLSSLPTEQRNPHSMRLDQMSALEIAQTMNAEDELVAQAVRAVLPKVADAIDLVAGCLSRGGRIIYIGAGTSGRLGLLDAAECPPTFGVSPDAVIALIAGGQDAFHQAAEGAEDSTTLCQEQLMELSLTSDDIVIGIAASGRTPYVVHGLRYARSISCPTVAIVCVKDSIIGREVDIAIEPETGPEVLTGSTRLKAGTAEKMVLNMISTGSMVCLGKVYQNLMVDMQQTNGKLRKRARSIVMQATDCTGERAEQALVDSEGDVKTAIVMIALGVSREQAARLLHDAKGRVGMALRQP